MNLAATRIFSFVSPMFSMKSPSGRTRKMYFSISTVLIRVPMWRPAAKSSSSERRRFSARGIASLSSKSWLSMRPKTLSEFCPSLRGHLRISQELIDQLDMSYEHPSTAVSPDSQFVKDFLGLVSCSDPLIEGFPLVSYLLPTSEASYWNYHRSTITCTISVFFFVRLVHRTFWVL